MRWRRIRDIVWWIISSLVKYNVFIFWEIVLPLPNRECNIESGKIIGARPY
jgi:hypothetical protein